MNRLKIKAVIMAVLAVALATAACNKGGASSPTAAFKAFYEASKKKDVEAARKMFSKRTLELFEVQAKAQSKTVEDMLKAGLERKPMPEKMPETRNEKINGDEATLEIKDDESSRWDTLTFVKEDGQWKIALDKMGTQTPNSK
jgi:uncharacterized lipoprotein